MLQTSLLYPRNIRSALVRSGKPFGSDCAAHRQRSIHQAGFCKIHWRGSARTLWPWATPPVVSAVDVNSVFPISSLLRKSFPLRVGASFARAPRALCMCALSCPREPPRLVFPPSEKVPLPGLLLLRRLLHGEGGYPSPPSKAELRQCAAIPVMHRVMAASTKADQVPCFPGILREVICRVGVMHNCGVNCQAITPTLAAAVTIPRKDCPSYFFPAL